MLALVALALLSADPKMEPPGWGTAFAGKAAVRVLTTATRVEAFRVLSHDRDAAVRKQTPPVARFAGYAITAQAAVPADLAKRLAAALLADTTYERLEVGTGSIKLCGGFHPGVGVRFVAGKDVAEVLICFDCDDVGFVRGLAPGGKGAQHWPESDLADNPYRIAVRDSSDGRKALLALVREAFPADEALKALKD